MGKKIGLVVAALRAPKWDTTKVLGRKPKKMIAYPALAEWIPAGGEFCADIPAGSDVLVWRTKGRQPNAGRKFVEAQLPVKVGRKAPGGGFVGAFYSGAWLDDGDGIPEDPATSDDAYECTGFTLTSFRVRGKVDLSPVRAERLRSLVP